MSQVVAQRIDPSTRAAASWEDQEALAPPGAYQVFLVAYKRGELFPEPHEQLEYDVNCPGCGKVSHLRHPEYPITDNMTCTKEIHFARCCGWRGTLESGIWREQVG